MMYATSRYQQVCIKESGAAPLLSTAGLLERLYFSVQNVVCIKCVLNEVTVVTIMVGSPAHYPSKRQTSVPRCEHRNYGCDKSLTIIDSTGIYMFSRKAVKECRRRLPWDEV